MKTSYHSRSSYEKGSALITVMMLSLFLVTIAATMLQYSFSEQKLNERNRLNLRTRVMAENLSNYTAAQVSSKLYAYGTAPVGYFAWTGTGQNRLYMPPNAILDNGGYTDPTVGMEVRCGIRDATDYATVTDPTSTDRGLQTSSAMVELVAKATGYHPLIGNTTAYVQQDLELVLKPLFQFGMFYNMDLELYPNPNFTISGPVHSNKNIMAHTDGSSTNTITFLDRVSTASYFIADHSLKAIPRGANGNLNPPTATSGNIMLKDANTPYTSTNLKNGSSLWRDSRWLTTTLPPSSTANTNFKGFATTTYHGNLQTEIHGIEPLVLPGVGGYDQDTAPNSGREIIESPDHKRYNGAAFNATTDTDLLKKTKISWRAGLYILVNPDGTQRSGKLPNGSTVQVRPFAYRSFLNYIDSGTGIRSCKEVILPGQPSWGYYVTAVAGDKGMYKNTLPNRYTNTTKAGRNQVLRIPMSSENAAGTNPTYTCDAVDALADADTFTVVDTTAGRVAQGDTTTGYPTRIAATTAVYPAFPADAAAAAAVNVDEAYFFDIRRADNNGPATTATGAGSYGRGVSNAAYLPRPIAKIDLDLARLRLMVARSMYGSTQIEGYQLDRPDGSGNRWSEFIYNPAATTSANNINLGLDNPGTGGVENLFPDGANLLRRDPFRLYYPPTIVTPGTLPAIADGTALVVPTSDLSAAWYDGVAIYIHSLDAEQRGDSLDADTYPDRIDSGVRLWNARGPVATLTAATKTGCTIATNDAVYIVGHYNADGTVNGTTTATGNGGFSAKYPDSANEKLCAVMGDAVTILSQPIYRRVGASPSYTYEQINGWCDALSAFPVVASSSGWRTSAAGNDDGLYNSTYKPGYMPQRNVQDAASTVAARDNKLTPLDTEISTALLVGVVPSHHNPTGKTDRAPFDANGTVQTVSGKVGNNVNSGGANNFPRLLENWGSINLYIRGSMVAMFESRVAMEPFSHSRCYRAANRLWGLHYDFSQAQHDVPLEPIVIGANTLGFRELTAAEYETTKTFILSLGAIP